MTVETIRNKIFAIRRDDFAETDEKISDILAVLDSICDLIEANALSPKQEPEPNNK